MRILHTSDWHIGKRLKERERLAEQTAALSHLAKICEEKKVDLVLVAGDVFDSYLPSAEAEEVFFRAVKEIAGETRAVVLISGNHDDGVRLSASAPLAGMGGIYIFGNKSFVPPQNAPRRPVFAAEAGEHHIVIENAAGERVYINALPYPNEARLREDKTEESFPEKMVRWIARGEENYRGDMPYILLAHLFVAGGRTSESERDIDLGGARAVPVHCLPDHGYIALGHLHKRQSIANAEYCGSLLQYSFDEGTEQKFLLLETRGKEIVLKEEIPVEGGKKLVSLEANSVEAALELLPRYEGSFIRLKLHLKSPLTTAETQALHAANGGLAELSVSVSGTEELSAAGRKDLDTGELFTEFYRAQYGEEPSDALKEAFLSLFEEEA